MHCRKGVRFQAGGGNFSLLLTTAPAPILGLPSRLFHRHRELFRCETNSVEFSLRYFKYRHDAGPNLGHRTCSFVTSYFTAPIAVAVRSKASLLIEKNYAPCEAALQRRVN